MDKSSNDHYIKNGRFFYQDTLLLSTDKIDYFENKISNIKNIENTLFVFPSPISANMDLVIKNNLADSSYAIYLEADNYLYKYFTEQEKTLYPIYFLEKLSGLLEIGNIFLMKKIRKIRFLYITRGYKLNEQLYRDAETSLNNMLEEFWKNRFTQINFGKTWIRNIIKNIKILENKSNFRSFNQLKTNKDVLVCGAGDSLEHALPWIKANRDDVFVLASDTAARSLIEYDIIPDAISALEAQQHNILDFYNVFDKSIPLICDICSYPSIIAQNKGPIYLYASKFADLEIFRVLEKFLPGMKIINPLGDIGTTSIYLAKSITTKNVFFTGVDFANLNGKPHAKSAYTQQAVLANNTRILSSEMYFNSGDGSSVVKQLNKDLVENVRTEYRQGANADSLTRNVEYLVSAGKAIPFYTLRYENTLSPQAYADEKNTQEDNSHQQNAFQTDKSPEKENNTKITAAEIFSKLKNEIDEFLAIPTEEVFNYIKLFTKFSWLYFHDINCPFDKKEDLDKAKSYALYLKNKFF